MGGRHRRGRPREMHSQICNGVGVAGNVGCTLLPGANLRFRNSFYCGSKIALHSPAIVAAARPHGMVSASILVSESLNLI